MTDQTENYHDDGTTICPEHTIWLCQASGRMSQTRYGFDKDNNRTSDSSWDESNMLHAVLVHKSSIERNEEGDIVAAKSYKDPAALDDLIRALSIFRKYQDPDEISPTHTEDFKLMVLGVTRGQVDEGDKTELEKLSFSWSEVEECWCSSWFGGG